MKIERTLSIMLFLCALDISVKAQSPTQNYVLSKDCLLYTSTFTSRLGYRITQSNYHNYETPYWLSSMAHSENYTIEATNHYLQAEWMWRNSVQLYQGRLLGYPCPC